MIQLMVTCNHLHEARRRYGGYCTRGVAMWFDKYGMSFRHFLRNGYSVEQIEATQDEFGLRVARIAREQENEQ